MYQRDTLSLIEKWLQTPEIIVIYGARQVGKSTLLGLMSEKVSDMAVFNCENPFVSDVLQSRDIKRILALFGNCKFVAFDEAQVIPEIGRILKFLYDDREVTQKIIATGSSSFDLANKTGEPLTGRNIKFRMYPLSVSEIVREKGWLKTWESLGELLVYGSYPGMIDLPLEARKKKLVDMSGDYLYKDIFRFEQLRNPEILRKLLKAIALQTGNLVSLHELAGLTGVSIQTVERYLDLLEKSFIIFRLGSLSNNLRNELKKSRKYYYFDNGIRNAVINNFVSINDRTDIGALWENFCISEKLKSLDNSGTIANFYFWRTYDGAEIDLVEERDGKLYAYEFKWNPSKGKSLPASFLGSYPVAGYEVVNRDSVRYFTT